jgi:hypothetical protein
MSFHAFSRGARAHTLLKTNFFALLSAVRMPLLLCIDFWRYTKLFLEGGVYADANVEPLDKIVKWVRWARLENQTVFFEESNFHNMIYLLSHIVVPLVTNYTELPTFATVSFFRPAPALQFFSIF